VALDGATAAWPAPPRVCVPPVDGSSPCPLAQARSPSRHRRAPDATRQSGNDDPSQPRRRPHRPTHPFGSETSGHSILARSRQISGLQAQGSPRATPERPSARGAPRAAAAMAMEQGRRAPPSPSHSRPAVPARRRGPEILEIFASVWKRLEGVLKVFGRRFESFGNGVLRAQKCMGFQRLAGAWEAPCAPRRPRFPALEGPGGRQASGQGRTASRTNQGRQLLGPPLRALRH
jgi:hypothetical protein